MSMSPEDLSEKLAGVGFKPMTPKMLKATKACHMCGIRQQPDNPAFNRCAKCKQVLYCSRTCQVKNWPNHKAMCKEGGEGRNNLLSKWHKDHYELIRQIFVCALDLANHPTAADNFAIWLRLQRKPDHEKQPEGRKYLLEEGTVVPMEIFDGILRDKNVSEDAIATMKRQNAHLKTQGNMGVGMAILTNDDHDVNFITIILPPPSVAKQMAKTDAYWHKNWETMVKKLLKFEGTDGTAPGGRFVASGKQFYASEDEGGPSRKKK